MRCIAAGAAALVTLSCMLPMGLSPKYNGEDPEHRNQYELITEAFLAGQLSFQYDNIDPRLQAMENPYDAEERERLGVYYYWDHAFYDGQYYMYFGVVPVLLAFLPYRLITGKALAGYHVTQLYTGVFIAGVFALFWLLGRKFLKRMPLSLYLLLSAAVSYLSVWNAVATPQLYSMTIICALGLAVWSLYCFARAVFCIENENRAIACAALGSLLGALVFGCRPTVGFFNLLVLPLLGVFLNKHRLNARLACKLLLAALPYVLVAAGLMWYNWARYDNPFEFGQAYQLTVTDQSGYGSMLSHFSLPALLSGLRYYLLNLRTPDILPSNGLLITFPVLTAGLFCLDRKSRAVLREKQLTPFAAVLMLSVLVIIVFDLLWAPHPTPRYRMDFSWLLGIAAFIMIGCACERRENPARFSRIIGVLCLVTMAAAVLLALYPQGQNFTEYYSAEIKALLGLR
ncbi:MAG: hypothetical protein ACI4MP_09485 [Candidatus Ventricola sp.]